MNNGFVLSRIDLPEGTEIEDDLGLLIHTCLVDEPTNSKLSCFTFRIKSEEILESIWQNLTNEIAINYIAHLENSFSKWNCYIVFLCSPVISKDLKYKIENNKFAARKIVLDSLPEVITEDALAKMINDRVLDFNIELPETNQINRKNIELSEISQNLLSKGLLLDKKEDSIVKRQEWINKELKRIMASEN